jgi:hypothetical protein
MLRSLSRGVIPFFRTIFPAKQVFRFYHQSRVSVAGCAPKPAATGAGWHGSGNYVLLTQVHTGVLADVYSRLAVILGLALMGVGSLLEGSIPQFWAILLSQALWGVGVTFTDGAAANFSWRNGKRRDKLFSEHKKREFESLGLLQLAHPLFASLQEWRGVYEQKLQFGCSHSADCQRGLPWRSRWVNPALLVGKVHLRSVKVNSELFETFRKRSM